MLKTYRIIPLVFILFFFGFTLITVAPVFAQTPISMEQLIERVEKLEAFHAGDTATPSLTQPSSPHTPVVTEPHAKVTGGSAEPLYATHDDDYKLTWDKSMGIRHPARPCMIAGKTNPRKNCGPDMRSPEQIASDPYDTNNPASQAARAKIAAGFAPEVSKAAACTAKGGKWKIEGGDKFCLCSDPGFATNWKC
jgi:hypothetical protein